MSDLNNETFLPALARVMYRSPQLTPQLLSLLQGPLPAGAAGASADPASQKGLFDIIRVVAQHAPDAIDILTSVLSKGYQPPSVAAAAPNQKGLFDIIRVVAQHAPDAIDILTNVLSKDFQPPSVAAAAPNQKGLFDIIRVVAQHAPDALNLLSSVLSKGYQPGAAPSRPQDLPSAQPVADEKIWGLIASLAASAAPEVVRAVVNAVKSGAPTNSARVAGAIN